MAKLRNARTPATVSIEGALHQLNSNGMGILFIEDASSRIIGRVTDGDVRRQLLVDGDLNVSLSTFVT
jgi:predicted transcriptional regulator